jgi:hypothetical protein
VLLERGVVDEDVEPAELLHRPLDSALAEARLADVAADDEAAPPLALFDDARRGDVRPLAREQHRHRAADAGVAAGD